MATAFITKTEGAAQAGREGEACHWPKPEGRNQDRPGGPRNESVTRMSHKLNHDRPGGLSHGLNQDRPGGLSHPARDPYQLRVLPCEDVFFYSKKIDNSRLVRQPDPRGHGACWSAIVTACLALALLTAALAPGAAHTLAGYKLEALRAEERRLLDQRRVLELREAELVSPDRLEALAKGQNLVVPAAGQTLRLEPKGDGSLALVRGSQGSGVRGR